MKQATPYYCGPACLSFISGQDQQTMASIAGTTTNGTGIKGIKAGLRFLGLHPRPVAGKMHYKAAPTHQCVLWDRTRDHWMVGRRQLDGKWDVFDPETGAQSTYQPAQWEKAFFSNWDSYGIFF